MKPLKPEIPQAAALLMVTALATLPGVKMRTLTREVGALPLPLEAAALCERARVGASLEAAAEAAALRAEVDAAMPNPLRDFARRADDLHDAAARRFDEKLRAEAAACGAAARLGDVRASRWHAAGSARLRRELDAAQLSLLRAYVASLRRDAARAFDAELADAFATKRNYRRAAARRRGPRDGRLRAPRARRAARRHRRAARLARAARGGGAETGGRALGGGGVARGGGRGAAAAARRRPAAAVVKQILQQLIVAAIQMGLHVAGQQYKVWKAARALRGAQRDRDGGRVRGWTEILRCI